MLHPVTRLSLRSIKERGAFDPAKSRSVASVRVRQTGNQRGRCASVASLSFRLYTRKTSCRIYPTVSIELHPIQSSCAPAPGISAGLSLPDASS
jgi:hypothetical protein